MKSGLPLCLLSFALTISGCRSTGKPSPEISSGLVTPDVAISDAETADTTAPRWKPLTFIDKPELQAGTGAMDEDFAQEFSETDSGLKYRILRDSDGKKATSASTVSVNYRGWLNSGKVFDSSYARTAPTTFPLRDVIAGWREGMQLVGEGGMIELWVPSRLGYGKSGSPGSIPPHSNLHFVVELVSVD